MAVMISLLRGVNVGGHCKISMEALRQLYDSLGLREPGTYVNSGNVVFKTSVRNLATLRGRIESAIEERFGFRPNVILRSASDLQEVTRKNPFAGRSDIHPSRLLVMFLDREPEAPAREKVLAMPVAPEELHIRGRELYIYYPNGMARPTVPWTTIEKVLATPGTCRNWNTVSRLLEMAEKLDV